MMELLTLLAIYYQCGEEAIHGRLTQAQRFACNESYQQAKALFLDEAARAPGARITPAQNAQAYLRFKMWERENAEIVQSLKQR
ncbi:MAG: hypothetical protein OXC60_14865 [Litoreibacter sp.]|nr:hypothetical protein [Litoreibacter sp.]